jgi:hypothetical protein
MEPAWQASIPSRYLIAKDINSTQKILIGLISSLSNMTGYCFASNEYFEELTSIKKVTISQLISDLERKGYVKRIIKRDEKKQVIQRILVLDLTKEVPLKNEVPPFEIHDTLPLKSDIPPIEKRKDNIKINININNKDNKEQQQLVFISDEWKGLWAEWKEYRLTETKKWFKSSKYEQMAINKLVKESDENLETAQNMVLQSIENQWKSIYKLKTNTNVTTFTGNKPSNADIYKQRREEMHRIAAEIDRQRGIRP